jgi:dihydropyrimidinase
MLDLVIKHGTVVTSGSMGVGDVGVEDGRVVAIGGSLAGRREIDARDRFVLPGGVDVHVHLSLPSPPAPGTEAWVDDFHSGSQAAIAGGVTTIGNMTFQWKGETLRGALERDMAAATRDAAIDFILHPVLMEPSDASLAEIPSLAADGHTSMKIFMVMEHFDHNVAAYVEAIRIAGRSGTLTMVHCEDGPLVQCACRQLLARSLGAPRHYPDSKPIYTETAAVERAVAFARATGAPLYLVHLSSAEALDACRRARARGIPIYVETRPMYLYLTRSVFEHADAAKYVGSPPLRETADTIALWHALWSGEVQCLCSDHAPWTLQQKLDPALDVTTVRHGVADLETLMPMLYSEGVHAGRISLSRFVELTSTNTAKLFGMYPQKGTIAVGSDADLVVWDPKLRRTVDGAAMHSRAGYSVYDGREVRGGPLFTISRGDVVYEDGRVTAQRGRGQWVRRAATAAL